MTTTANRCYQTMTTQPTQPTIIIQRNTDGAWRASATGLTRAETIRASRLALMDLVRRPHTDDITPAFAAAYPRLTALLRSGVTR